MTEPGNTRYNWIEDSLARKVEFVVLAQESANLVLLSSPTRRVCVD